MLISQTSLIVWGESSGSVAKCQLFSQATPKGVTIAFTQLNMVPSHMKITPLLWPLNKQDFCRLNWYFIGVHIVNKTLRSHLMETQTFCPCVTRYLGFHRQGG